MTLALNALHWLRFAGVGAMSGAQWRPVLSRMLGLILLLVLAVAVPQALSAQSLPKAMVLREGDIRLQGPEGYCPDPATLRQTDETTVVLMGRCVASEALPAVITVTLGRPGSASVLAVGGEQMAAFFTTEAGRKTLSRRGRASDVTVTSARTVGDLFLFRVADRAEGNYWRGMTAVKGRMISIKVSGPELPETESRRLVQSTSGLLRRTNR